MHADLTLSFTRGSSRHRGGRRRRSTVGKHVVGENPFGRNALAGDRVVNLEFPRRRDGTLSMDIQQSLRILVCAGLVSACCAGDLAAEPLKLRIGWAVVPAQIAPIMLEPPGVARHNGTSYVLEPIRFQGSGQTLQALGAGELEIAPMTFIQLAPAIQNAGMTDLRIIADEFRDGVEDYETNQYMVRGDSPIQKVEDLKGKVFAVNGIGSGQDVFARVMLRRHGVEYPRDYTMIESNFPTMRAMLAEKKADLVVGVKPFTEDATFKAIARTLFTQKEAVGTSDMIFLTAKADFIQKNRPAVLDFFEDYIRSLRWYMDPANHAAVVEIVTRFTKVPQQQLQWIFTKQDFYRDPSGKPDLAAIQRGIDLLREFNFVKSDLAVNKFADLTLVEEAGSRIK
jgi:NitT/TauT family transport system substrate-binding protein